MSKAKRSNKIWHFDVLVCDGFVLTELAAVTDPIRIANRTLAQPQFSWSYVSVGGGLRKTHADVMVDTKGIPERPTADFLFVLGNSNPDHPGLSLSKHLRKYTFAGAKVFLLAEAATRFISEEGKGQAHATHWENSNLLRERLGFFEVGNQLAADNGPIVTCAGMEATVDVVLSLIGNKISAAAEVTVANIMLHETVRDPSTLQPTSALKSSATGDADLDRCIRIMQDNIEEPIGIGEMVAELGISPRSLERKFKARLGCSPITFYREIRLHRANNLLLNTSMGVREVGLACGFGNGFSSLYKSFFGITPAVLRRQRRQQQLAE